MKILIVEDDKEQAELLQRDFIKKIVQPLAPKVQVNIEIAGTLVEALAHAATANVTILDLNLPDSDPVKTISSIGAFRPPVIVMTGTDDEDMMISCKLHGASHVFVKGQIHGLCRVVLESMMRDVLVTQGFMASPPKHGT